MLLDAAPRPAFFLSIDALSPLAASRTIEKMRLCNPLCSGDMGRQVRISSMGCQGELLIVKASQDLAA